MINGQLTASVRRSHLSAHVGGESSLRQPLAYEFTKRARDLEAGWVILWMSEGIQRWVDTFYCRLTILWLQKNTWDP